jgi:hypothetical protein
MFFVVTIISRRPVVIITLYSRLAAPSVLLLLLLLLGGVAGLVPKVKGIPVIIGSRVGGLLLPGVACLQLHFTWY